MAEIKPFKYDKPVPQAPDEMKALEEQHKQATEEQDRQEREATWQRRASIIGDMARLFSDAARVHNHLGVDKVGSTLTDRALQQKEYLAQGRAAMKQQYAKDRRAAARNKYNDDMAAYKADYTAAKDAWNAELKAAEAAEKAAQNERRYQQQADFNRRKLEQAAQNERRYQQQADFNRRKLEQGEQKIAIERAKAANGGGGRGQNYSVFVDDGSGKMVTYSKQGDGESYLHKAYRYVINKDAKYKVQENDYLPGLGRMGTTHDKGYPTDTEMLQAIEQYNADRAAERAKGAEEADEDEMYADDVNEGLDEKYKRKKQ